MASPTVYNPSLTLPAYITSPPTAQYTPGPGCVDPEDHWVVVTSCYANALGEDYTLQPSPDWLTCQLTQFGPPENTPRSCYIPYTAQTVVDAETTFYSGCPSGYTGASTFAYSYSDGLENDFNIYCCPTQYNFNVDGYGKSDFKEFTTERDGVSYYVGYPLPGCATSYISELSGSKIAVQTDYNTYGWEKRQVGNVPWDYLYGTMYAEIQTFSYTVFMSTHTCYGDCYDWRSYYFSGGIQPPFTTPVEEPTTTTAIEEPTTTTPVEESTTSALTLSESEAETSLIEESSSIEETSELPISTTSAQTTSSSDGGGLPSVTSSVESTPTPTPSESNENITLSSTSSPSTTTTTANVPTGSAALVIPAHAILLGFFVLLIALQN
ncbi:hypothetical protein F4821DRAFT_242542 [Hypoxylon rubiginosum]|uniref:Uncharacterized protein n=1 Tax=Hypoxylon rubiginosum TaxID=110542 RepID=A0ACC0CVV4_9PEZI|nr:hypothetical protein F4821DRAFT_242542 [Hypoxylon rubiginosum]